jgi:HEPN domain-containing protein
MNSMAKLTYTQIPQEFIAVKNMFIDECFITTADKDYLTARICYKFGFFENFVWCSQQCIEKYIKGVLLYNDYSTKEVGHNLKKGMDLINQIPDIKWDFDAIYNSFVCNYLNDYGVNRYFESPIRNMFPVSSFVNWAKSHQFDPKNESNSGYFAFVNSNEYKNTNYLNQLDNSVWQIRRYCLNIPFQRQYHSFRISKYLEFIVRKDVKENPSKYKPEGFLRDVQQGKLGTDIKKALFWRNRFFSLKNRKSGGLLINHFEKMPPHLRYTQLIQNSWFKNNIKSTKDFKDAIKNQLGITI